MPIMNCKESVTECGRAIEISEEEKEAVLRAAAMLTLADDIDVRAGRQGPYPAVRLTRAEWDLICYALRHTADSDN